ncbi:MAG: hypothetical protein KDH94_07620, partial [Coxiellaceae bacterium]|nr:hypothetical protein [Coxiellaceae bacterium]
LILDPSRSRFKANAFTEKFFTSSTENLYEKNRSHQVMYIHIHSPCSLIFFLRASHVAKAIEKP